MNARYLLHFAVIIFLMATCKSQQQELQSARVRQVRPAEVASYHQPIQLTIAWYPYENQALQRTGKNEWKIVKSDTNRSGALPVILIRYPETGDSIWMDMNTKSEVLGKLLKHSLMTQEPITQPFGTYLETASCTRCHPADVAVDFDR